MIYLHHTSQPAVKFLISFKDVKYNIIIHAHVHEPPVQITTLLYNPKIMS